MSRLDGLKKKGRLKNWPLIRSHLDPHWVQSLEFRKFFGDAGERHCSLYFRASAARKFDAFLVRTQDVAVPDVEVVA